MLALRRWFHLRRNAVSRFYVAFDCAGSLKVCISEIAINFEGIVLPGSDMNFTLHGRCEEIFSIFSCEGQKREFTWQVRGIGQIVKIVAGAVFCGRCQNVRKGFIFRNFETMLQKYCPCHEIMTQEGVDFGYEQGKGAASIRSGVESAMG